MKIAKESLLDTTIATHTKDEVKYYLVTNADNALDLAGKTTLAPTSSLPIYLRFKLENMVLGAAINGAAAGGGVGDNFVVMQYMANTGGESRVVMPGSLGVRPDMPGSLTVTAHVSALDALRGRDAIDTTPQMQKMQ